MTRSCEKLCGPRPGSKYTKKGKHRKEKKEDRDVVKKEVGVLVGGGGWRGIEMLLHHAINHGVWERGEKIKCKSEMVKGWGLKKIYSKSSS